MVSELTEDQLAGQRERCADCRMMPRPRWPAATPAPEADPTVPQARAFWWLLPLAAVLAALAAWGIARARAHPGRYCAGGVPRTVQKDVPLRPGRRGIL